MVFHYAGKYDGEENKLPHKEHHPKAVPFKEPEDSKALSLIANIGCIALIILLSIPFIFLGKSFIPGRWIWIIVGAACSCLSLLPHEFLHAICYKEDVYLYTDFAHGLVFVIGTEDMGKWHFVFMCLCPNIIFGLIPYIVFLLWPHHVGLGFFGIICIGMGFGDYLNVYNAIKQMPQNAKTYLCGMHL